MDTNYIIWNYGIYTITTIAITIWVANVLRKNGEPFLKATFKNDEVLAGAVNKLLNVGFYLVNVGYLIFTIKTTAPIEELRVLIETLGWKIGKIVLILGVMHFINMFVLLNLRKNAINREFYKSFKVEKPNPLDL